MNPNEVLSEQMRVKPLKDGEKAVFRLLNANTKERGREEPTCPENVWLSDKELVWDPFVKKSILIGNVSGLMSARDNTGQIKTENGVPVMVVTTEKPKFVKGYCVLNAEQPATFAYLMRSKKCKDNPYRSKRVKAVFELVTDDKKKNLALLQADLQFDAEGIVRTREWTDMKAIKAKLNQSSDGGLHVKADDNDFKGLKLELIRIAKTNPKQLIMASEDIPSKVKVMITEAQMFGILTVIDKSWSLMDREGKWSKICTVLPHKDEITTLQEHFMSKEGHDSYVKATKELEFILKAPN